MRSRKPLLTTELRLETDSGDSASFEALPAPVMQALYHELTGRTESLEQSFSKSVIINHSDIVSLVQKLTQFAQSYNVTAADSQFSISFYDQGKQHFSSLTKFQQIDYETMGITNGLSLIFSFVMKAPGFEGRFQNYKFILELDSFVYTNDKNSLRFGGIGRLRNNIEMKIEYVDYIIARNISNLFKEWIDSLEKSLDKDERDSLVEFDERTIENFFIFGSQFSLIFLISGIHFYFEDMLSFNSMIYLFACFAIAASGPYLFRTIFVLYIDNRFR